MKSILIVEDNILLRQTLYNIFNSPQLNIHLSPNLESAYKILNKITPDLVIADRVLPDGDGLELVEYLNSFSYQTKILILSDRGETIDKISGLKNGADDYLAKPFSNQELLLRANLLLQKNKIKDSEVLKFGPLELLITEGQLKIDSKPTKLRKKELKLLKCLFINKNKVVTRDQISNHLWGLSEEVPSRTAIDVYIRRIRVLLGDNSEMLETCRGYGYKLKLPATKSV